MGEDGEFELRSCRLEEGENRTTGTTIRFSSTQSPEMVVKNKKSHLCRLRWQTDTGFLEQ